MLCVDLGFHVVIGVGRLTVQQESFYKSTAFHHAYAIPSTKFFSPGCCSPTLSCHRQLNLYHKFLHISHCGNGSFEVLSLHHLLKYSRPPSAVDDLAVTKENEFLKAIRLRFSPKFCKQRVAPIDHKPLIASSFLTFCEFLGRPPGFLPLPPG